MGCEAVYCIDGESVRRVVSQPDIGRPNGLAITPDDKTLYVVDSHNVAGGNRKIWAFDVDADGVSPASGWCSTSAPDAAATACDSTGKATCGSPPA